MTTPAQSGLLNVEVSLDGLSRCSSVGLPFEAIICKGAVSLPAGLEGTIASQASRIVNVPAGHGIENGDEVALIQSDDTVSYSCVVSSHADETITLGATYEGAPIPANATAVVVSKTSIVEANVQDVTVLHAMFAMDWAGIMVCYGGASDGLVLVFPNDGRYEIMQLVLSASAVPAYDFTELSYIKVYNKATIASRAVVVLTK